MWLKRWRRRYFSLQGRILCFSKDNNSNPHGLIDLTECKEVISIENGKVPTKYAFQLNFKKESYSLCADTEEDKRIWMEAVSKIIESTSHGVQKMFSSDIDIMYDEW